MLSFYFYLHAPFKLNTNKKNLALRSAGLYIVIQTGFIPESL
jgi:hypothetical protein